MYVHINKYLPSLCALLEKLACIIYLCIVGGNTKLVE